MLDVAVFLFRPSQTAEGRRPSSGGRDEGHGQSDGHDDKEMKKLGPEEGQQNKIAHTVNALPEELILFRAC